MSVQSSSWAKVKRERKAAGGSHGPVIKLWVVLAAESCGSEGSSGRKTLVEFSGGALSHLWH